MLTAGESPGRPPSPTTVRRAAIALLAAGTATGLAFIAAHTAPENPPGFGDPKLAWYSFQVLYDHILALQPDSLDKQVPERRDVAAFVHVPIALGCPIER
ncbi:hypothetical protein ILP97_37255 [Amycolatopsis sp. H6(2020)]|nr:hypothetical protein [Amycolatopsis sp. H6(2020)]